MQAHPKLMATLSAHWGLSKPPPAAAKILLTVFTYWVGPFLSSSSPYSEFSQSGGNMGCLWVTIKVAIPLAMKIIRVPLGLTYPS